MLPVSIDKQHFFRKEPRINIRLIAPLYAIKTHSHRPKKRSYMTEILKKYLLIYIKNNVNVKLNLT